MTEELEPLSKLCAAERYAEAAACCKEKWRAAQTPEVARLWSEQLGYVLFLDEMGEEHYEAAATFAKVVEEAPENVNARFWLGYMSLILFVDEEVAQRELREVLRRDPRHPYAHLVLAGMLPPQEALPHLEEVLALQPGNRRALGQLAEVYESLGELLKAAEARRALATCAPYIERGYGLMNKYINEVFIHGAVAEGLSGLSASSSPHPRPSE